MSKDLLRQAIADAKTVKETAIANAKLSLEEAFMPRIQSMISAKLQNEAEEDEFNEYSEEETIGDLETPEGEYSEEFEDYSEETPEGEEFSSEEEIESEPEISEPEFNPEEDEEVNLDELLAELEAFEPEEDEDDDVLVADPETETLPDVKPTKSPMVPDLDDEPDGNPMFEMEDEEEIDLNDLHENEDEETTMDLETLKQDLNEAYNVIKVLRTQINEVNLLNAKLLYSNKLFKNHNLTDKQKYNIIENFDKAKNVREVKLVFSTLSESLKGKKVTIKESVASKTIGSTKPKSAQQPKQILNEEAQIAARFKKLAGIIK